MFIGIALGRFSYTTMVPPLVQSGQLSELEAGYVGGANLIGFFFGAFFAEQLRRFIAVHKLLPLALWLAVLALGASALTEDFFGLAILRSLLGVIAGLVMVQSTAFATAAAPPDKRPVAAGYVYAGVGLGVFFTGTLAPTMLEQGIVWAWLGFALAGFISAIVAHWGWAAANILPSFQNMTPNGWPRNMTWWGLVAANFLFSFGIVPHTIYWLDFLVRGIGYSMEMAGLQWSIVGIFAFLGPIISAIIATRIGTSATLVLAFVLLGLGVSGPAFLSITAVFWLSSIIYGAQTGVASILAASARGIGKSAADMPQLMRVLILSNACGAAAGGILFPTMLNLGSYEWLFICGGTAILLGGMIALIRKVPD